MSVPIAVTGWIPKTRINRGVIKEPPPMPVRPTRKPTPKPNKTIIGSTDEVGGTTGLWGTCGAAPDDRRRRHYHYLPFLDRESPKRVWAVYPIPAGRPGERRSSPGHPGALVLGQREDLGREPAVAQVGDRDPLEHAAQGCADGDPDLAEALGVAGVIRGLGRKVLDVRQRPLDGGDHVGQPDLLGRLREPVAASCAAACTHEARVLQLQQDVLQELEGDVLGLGDLLALDRVLAGRGELGGGTDGVVRLGRNPHPPPPPLRVRERGARAPVPWQPWSCLLPRP